MVEPVNDNILNLVNELYNNLDAKDKIINEQALEIARLKEQIDKAIEYIKENACYGIQEKCCLDDLNYNECDELLELLGDKENE